MRKTIFLTKSKLQFAIKGLTLILLGIFTFTAMGQNQIHGFKLIEKRFVKEVNADCYYFEHVKSGAKLIKIANNDDNKTFCIQFKTLPYNDNGVAHILEHSVLNGSKNFPVKSPFDILSQSSLNTYLNATTSRDITAYPFASMNEKDYFNLMYVYCDAVFMPKIYSDTRILKQEGWHHELTDKDAPVIYKGVVYNEMKGAMSNPRRDLLYHTLKNVYPDNVYGKESGGIPSAITTLTQEEFANFHKKYYHPENSIIMLYGDADMNKELQFLNEKYLSSFTRTGNKIEIEDQKLFTEMKNVSAFYPVLENTPLADKTYLSLSFIVNNGNDFTTSIALNLLCEVLFNQESAPVRLALQKAGIGQDISAYIQEFKQSYLTITVQNANAVDKQKFNDIVISTLKEIVKNGVDKQELKGIFSRMEFQLREGSDAQKGISYTFPIRLGWAYGNDPLYGLEYEKHLVDIKKGFTTNYYENLIKKYIIDNKHAVLLSFEPKPGLDKERALEAENELKAFKSKLSETQIADLIKENNDLIAFQNKKDDPKDIATIPTLTLKDINPKATYFNCTEKKAGDNKVLHYSDFTNDIIYTTYNFDIRVIPQDLVPYSSLLSNLFGMMDTEKYTYGDLNRTLNTYTGEFYTSIRTYLEGYEDSKLIPTFSVTTKAMKENTDKMLELVNEVILKTKFSDTTRLKEVLLRHQSQIEMSLKQDGYGVAANRLPSYFSNEAMFKEITSGLEYYWFISTLVKDFSKNAPMIVENLKKVTNTLFTKENMFATISCSDKDYNAFATSFSDFSKRFPSKKVVYNTWNFKLEKKNEGILTASKVQYVLAGYDFKKLGYKWDAKMRVLNKVISSEWLHNQVRVIGGAYGGFSSFSLDGKVSFGSYRDPNLKKTIETYSKTPDFLNTFEADEQAMTRYIIGTIGDIDGPTTVQQKGNSAFRYYITKRTQNEVQKDRDAILSTKASDIKGFSKMVSDILNQNNICIYGNTDKIQQENENKLKLIKIEM